jgi:Xaa-Pro dipeptidase
MLVGADEGVHALLTRLVEIGIVRATCIPLEAEYWADRDDYVAMTADMIAAKGLSAARIGLQESALYLKLAEFRRLERLLPKVTFVDASDVVARLRLVKSPREIESMRRAAAITDAGLRAGIAAIAEGTRECDIAAATYAAMFAAGGRAGGLSRHLHLRPADLLPPWHVDGAAPGQGRSRRDGAHGLL